MDWLLGGMRKRHREEQALIKIVACMQAEQHVIIEDLARQVEQKLAALPPEDRLLTIRKLRHS